MALSGPPGGQGWFATAASRARTIGLTIPTLTPHSLWQVATGLPVSAGANAKAVRRQLGQASATVTLTETGRSLRTSWTP